MSWVAREMSQQHLSLSHLSPGQDELEASRGQSQRIADSAKPRTPLESKELPAAEASSVETRIHTGDLQLGSWGKPERSLPANTQSGEIQPMRNSLE